MVASAHMAYATMASQTGTRATSRWRCQGFSESSRLRRRSTRMGDSKSPFASFSLPSIWKAKAQIVVPCFVWHLYKAFFLRLHPDNLKHQGVADLLWLINFLLGFSTDASAVIFSMTPFYLFRSNWWYLSRFLIDPFMISNWCFPSHSLQSTEGGSFGINPLLMRRVRKR